jgi:F420-dependent oxidoreductase-like protein
MIEGQYGLTWPHWKQLVTEVEALGFAGLFRSDHFTNAQPPDLDSLETVVSLTYLASHSEKLHFGPLVAPVSFREPIMFARQAAALDDLSNGRMIIGLGAGWQDREHELFGFELGDMKTRMARFEEALEVVTRLLKSDEPVSFEGRFYQLRGATLLPRPQRPGGPSILIGGNGLKRTLSLAAKYADIWNGTFLSPEGFKERSVALDGFMVKAGRKPEDIQRTLMHTLVYARDNADLAQKVQQMQSRQPELQGLSVDEAVARIQQTQAPGGGAVIGTPELLIKQIKAYAEVGVEELMLQWFDLDDMAGLRSFATSVLPHL